MSQIKIQTAKEYNSNSANANMYMRTNSGSIRKTGMVVIFTDDTRRWFRTESEAYEAAVPGWVNKIEAQLADWTTAGGINHKNATGND